MIYKTSEVVKIIREHPDLAGLREALEEEYEENPDIRVRIRRAANADTSFVEFGTFFNAIMHWDVSVHGDYYWRHHELYNELIGNYS